MDVRERLFQLIEEARVTRSDHGIVINGTRFIAQYLIDHGVTITPEIPGPEIADPNIMELCFHNGEQNMKEKVYRELNRIAKEMPTMTVEQAISMMQGL